MKPQLSLKPTHKVVQDFYKEIASLQQLHLFHEGAVSPAFANLLKRCAAQFGWILSEQHRGRPHPLAPSPKGGEGGMRFDGALLDEFKLVHGIWEAKDSGDDLPVEIQKKFKRGYPKDNILFQSPERAILYQNGQMVMDVDIRQPEQLVGVLEMFFEYEAPAYEQWNEAVEEFKNRIHEYGESALAIIQQERRTNKRFIQAFNDFMEVCRTAINPNLSVQAVEEMLIQHLLTERLFRKVFNNPDFVRRNAIAAEIEKVIDALTSQSFSRAEFLRKLDRFYGAIEATAETIDEFSEKQAFLNVVYEKFFQGFSVKVADTHGIVYTPQPIGDFMVRSVEEILQREFGRSLSDEGVHILDPFVGTGNFIIRVMREIRKSALPHKFAHELHCNEVMLLPYYIASQNIEHAYYELTGEYQPFDGLCLVDTFQLAEGAQMAMSFMVAANTERVERQKKAPIFVIIGNPPYNAHQINENDNRKNRKYEVMDKRVAETYAADSAATNKNALSDPYVKAFRWASDRIAQTGEGIVAFVSNNSFLQELAFDGMRKNLTQDFDAIYTLNLTGNVRKNPKLSGTTHNVFGIQVGVNITFLVKHTPDRLSTGEDLSGVKRARIYYARTGEDWRKEEKYDFLKEMDSYNGIDWQELTPDARHTWLTEGLQEDFETFLPMGSKEAKAGRETTLFTVFSNGVKTHRDTWVYNFSDTELQENVSRMADTYNLEVDRWNNRRDKTADVDNFVLNDDTRIKWSSRLKECLLRGQKEDYSLKNIRRAAYRPFCAQFLYFTNVFVHRPGQFPKIFPVPITEVENKAIWLKVGAEWPMFALMINRIADQMPQGGSQCFSFYVYDTDGSNRRENISDWAVEQFRAHYGPHPLTPSPKGGEGGPESSEGGASSAPLLHNLEKRPGDEVLSPPLLSSERGPGGEVFGKRSASVDLWKKLKPLARQMRHDPTPAENHLWQQVRNRQVKNAKFRRQHAIDRFIVDFYCAEFNLVIEVDGEIHQYTPEEDAIRKEYLESQGLTVLRFTNDEVLKDIRKVITTIKETLTSQPPLSKAERGQAGEAIPPLPSLEREPGGEVREITKWDIFYYVYALLHSPAYREKYAANLKRDLPHIPFVDEVQPNPQGLPSHPASTSGAQTFRVLEGKDAFWHYVEAGRKLADLHVNYENQPEYPLDMVESPTTRLNWRVDKMKLSKDKTDLIYNDFLTLRGIPPETFAYRLGNRSALDWIIDQYRVTQDPRSKIINDPNNPDDPQYIVRLIKKVVTVSVETVRVVEGLG